jgi:hypothetical protein
MIPLFQKDLLLRQHLASDSWLSSLTDQNQGTRNDKARVDARASSQPFSFIRTLTVGLGFTPNLLTLAAKSMIRKSGNRFSLATNAERVCAEIMLKQHEALAGLGYLTLTAGGEFHPALRTSAIRNGWPDAKYGQTRTRQQAP